MVAVLPITAFRVVQAVVEVVDRPQAGPHLEPTLSQVVLAMMQERMKQAAAAVMLLQLERTLHRQMAVTAAQVFPTTMTGPRPTTLVVAEAESVQQVPM